MQWNKRQAFSFLLIGLFVLSFVSIVSAADPFGDFFGPQAQKVFGDWQSGAGFNIGLSKVLLTVIVILLLTSILKSFPGLDAEKGAGVFTRWAIAVIVGFLSMAFIVPAELYLILTSYSALGFTIGLLFPFLILMYWSFTILSSTGQRAWAGVWAVRAIWTVFGLFILYRLILLYISPADGSGVIVPDWVKTVMWIMVLAVLGFVFGAGAAHGMLVLSKRRTDALNVKDTIAKSTQIKKSEADEFDALAGGPDRLT